MVGISEIGNNAVVNSFKNPSFGSNATPSFGNAEYHDEFVRNDSGDTVKKVGLIGIVGLAVGIVAALAFKKPHAAERIEKGVIEIDATEPGILRRTFGGVKNLVNERRARLEGIADKYEEHEVAKVPNIGVRAARFLWPFNWFGKGAARVEGQRLAEQAYRVNVEAPAKAAREAEKAAKKAARDAEKAAEKKANREAAAQAAAAKKKDEQNITTSPLGSLAHLNNHEETLVERTTRLRAQATPQKPKSNVSNYLQAKLDAKKAAYEDNHGFFGKLFYRFGKERAEISRLERQVKLAKQRGGAHTSANINDTATQLLINQQMLNTNIALADSAATHTGGHVDGHVAADVAVDSGAHSADAVVDAGSHTSVDSNISIDTGASSIDAGVSSIDAGAASIDAGS